MEFSSSRPLLPILGVSEAQRENHLAECRVRRSRQNRIVELVLTATREDRQVRIHARDPGLQEKGIPLRLKRDPVDVAGREPDERLIGIKLQVDLVANPTMQDVDLCRVVIGHPDSRITSIGAGKNLAGRRHCRHQ